MIVSIIKDCRSRVKKALHGGDLTGRTGVISTVKLFIVGDKNEACVLSKNYPIISVGKHDIEGIECWWEPTGTVLHVGEEVSGLLRGENPVETSKNKDTTPTIESMP